MNKDELLKIYSAYLPYRLKGRTIYNPNCDDSNEDCTLALQDGLNNVVGIDDWVNQYSYPIKPYLYDLSYLTKEIDHEGESFIPIVELLKIKFPNQQGRYATTEYSTYGHPFACFRVDAGKQIRINTSDLENQPYWIIQKLTEWKLNVFGLEESEYINKANLTKK